MNRFASTRSLKCASQPGAGFAQWSVGSIDEDGIRYGFATSASKTSTSASATTIVTSQSMSLRALIRRIVARAPGSQTAARCGRMRAGRGFVGSMTATRKDPSK